MKQLLISLILLISSTAQAAFTKQSAEQLLNHFAEEKGKAYLEYSDKIKAGSGKTINNEYDKEIYKIVYYCKVNAMNTLIPFIAKQYPELALSYKALVDSAYNEESERKKISAKYGVKDYENDCGEKVPYKIN